MFGINIPLYIQSIVSQTTSHIPEDVQIAPSDAAMNFTGPMYPSVDSVLEATRNLLAQQIAAHPEFRHFVREIYRSDSVVTIVPTKRGITDIERTHPYYVMLAR
jgi:transcription elongation factor SPT6